MTSKLGYGSYKLLGLYLHYGSSFNNQLNTYRFLTNIKKIKVRLTQSASTNKSAPLTGVVFFFGDSCVPSEFFFFNMGN